MEHTLTTERPKGLKPQAQQYLPLSQSPIWALQRTYFHEQGVEAWRQNTVPSYITTNPFIAHSYAKVALVFIEDVASPSGDHPIHIVELGAGSGRFAYHFLRAFFEEYGEEAQRRQPVCYVMTDISEANIQFWEAHEQLKPFVAQGKLDFARYNPMEDDALALRQSGARLTANTLEQPLLCIANYFFDSVEQDIFEVRDGQLQQCLVALGDKQNGEALSYGEQRPISNTRLLYRTHPCGDTPYEDPHWNQLLAQYREQLTDGTTLLFPTAGLRCLERLKTLSGNRLLLLTADRGQHRLEDLQGRKPPQPSAHGDCFSLSVNYHALGCHTRQLGGVALQLPHLQRSLSINAFLWGEGAFANTQKAYRQHILDFGPDDFFTIKKGMEQQYNQLSLPQLRGLLRLSRWDAKILLGCHRRLLQLLPQATQQERQDFGQIVEAVETQHFFLKEPQPLGYVLGMLYAELRDYPKAIACYQRSQQRYGDHALLALNIALAYQHLGRHKEATEHALRSQQLDPQLAPARELLDAMNN